MKLLDNPSAFSMSKMACSQGHPFTRQIPRDDDIVSLLYILEESVDIQDFIDKDMPVQMHGLCCLCSAPIQRWYNFISAPVILAFDLGR